MTELLEQCLTEEEITPDSIYGNIRRLEKVCHTHPVYCAALARLYAERASLAQVYERDTPSHPDSLKEWSTKEWYGRSVSLFRESLADMETLHRESTKKWLPLVKRGKNEKVFGGDMLHVVWRTMQQCLPREEWRNDSLLCAERQIGFYREKGMGEAVRALTWEQNDSLARLTPVLTAAVAEVIYPGKDIRIAISSRNTKEMTLRVLSGKKTVVTKHIALRHTPATQTFRDTVTLPPMPRGRYTLTLDGKAAVKLYGKSKTARADFEVSPQKVFTMSMPDGNTRLWMVDAMTGKPMDTLMTDTSGTWYAYYYSPPTNEVRRTTAIFTDRAIYRPGQTVEVGGIAYNQRHWDVSVAEGITMPVVLRDARHRNIDTVWVQTDTMGVFSCRFTLPKEGRTGVFTIYTRDGMHSIRVEEYRRPTFYVTMTMDSVSAQGVAMGYNGVPLRNARVTASLSRLACWWYKRPREVHQLDTIYTDNEGHFTYTLPEIFRKQSLFTRLRIDATIQSQTGEAQEASATRRFWPDPPQPHEEDLWRRPVTDTLYVFETVISGRRVIRDTMWTATDSLSLPRIPYDEDYGDGAVVTWQYVKGGILHSRQETIRHPLPQDTLRMHWNTFRDLVHPGSKERWELTVTHSNGRPAAANVMLTLYDASLDALAQNDWRVSIWRNHNLPWAYSTERNNFMPYTQWLSYNMVHWYADQALWDFSQMDDHYFTPRYKTGYGYLPYIRGQKHRLLSASAMSVSDSQANNVLREHAVDKSTAPEAEEDDSRQQATGTNGLREDFSETSFFYPSLRTDGHGHVSVVFTLPESLTTWRLIGLAHTRSLERLSFSDTIIAQKPLMAELQLPRYMREGDEVGITATISNICSNRAKGQAILEVRDEETGRLVQREHVTFNLYANTDTLFRFRLRAGIHSALICRWQAESDDSSDGEQRTIPVIPNVQHITQSVALECTPEQLEKMNFDYLFPAAARNRALRKVVTDPVTSAKEALTSLTLPRYNDALTLAAHYCAETLLSAMHSPHATMYAREYSLSRLTHLLTEDGKIAWYSGMKGSEWITREVVRMFRRLERMMLHMGKEDRESDLFTMHRAFLRKAETTVGKILDEEHAMAVREAPKLKRRLTHPDGYYLNFPGGLSTSVDQRLAQHIDALELMQEVYPQDSDIHRALRHHILNERRTEGWHNMWLTVSAIYALLSGGEETGKEQWVGVFADYDMPYHLIKEATTGMSVSADVSMPDIQRVRITAERNFEHIHLTVPRTSLAEPREQQSGYMWKDGLSFYREIHDDRTEYFIESLPKGTYILEEQQYLPRRGKAATGVSTIECLYAPEYRAHSRNQYLIHQQ